jgi:hypothetical protein
MKYAIYFLLTVFANFAHAQDYPVLASYAFTCKAPGLQTFTFTLDKVRTEWGNDEFYNNGHTGIVGLKYGNDRDVYGAMTVSSRADYLEISLYKRNSAELYDSTKLAELRVYVSVGYPEQTAVLKSKKDLRSYTWSYIDSEWNTGSCSVSEEAPRVGSYPPYGLPSLPATNPGRK